jgi:excisionase family DNA binding protein
MPSSEVILLSVPEVAQRLAIKPSTVRAWLLRRKIGYVRVGQRAVRVPLSEIQKLIDKGTVPSREVRQ